MYFIISCFPVSSCLFQGVQRTWIIEGRGYLWLEGFDYPISTLLRLCGLDFLGISEYRFVVRFEKMHFVMAMTYIINNCFTINHDGVHGLPVKPTSSVDT